MIDIEYCQLMAEYNEWMNRKVLLICETMSDAQLREERGAFFGSIYLTLNHLVYADIAFLSRFTEDALKVPALGEDLFKDFSILCIERVRLDARIIEWASGLTSDWLSQPLTYVSKVDARERTVPRWILVVHLFNHQTHHRGQVTTLLSQSGLDVGSTDIPFMQRFNQAFI